MVKYQQLQYPMDSFGIKEVSHGQIRFERLETRLDPKVPFPHRHSFYQLLLVSEGQGRHSIDFTEHKVGPRSLFLMKPGQMHSWSFGPAVRGIIAEFNRESLPSIKDLPLLDHLDATLDFIPLGNKEFSLLRELFERGVSFNDINDSYREISLEAILINILVGIIRLKNLSKRNLKAHSEVHQFKILLEEYFKTHHELEFYAEKLGLTAKGLSMKISRSLGKPGRTLIHERIFLEAKRYLAFTELPIGVISQLLGFEDQNYFARFFKKMQGVSPSDFRIMKKS